MFFLTEIKRLKNKQTRTDLTDLSGNFRSEKGGTG